MSQEYEMAIITVPEEISVQRFLKETIQLGDVFGKIPLQELVEELESRVGSGQGWQRIEAGRLYRRSLDANLDIQLELRVEAAGQVALSRYGSAQTVEAWEQTRVEAEQEQNIQRLAKSYNTELGDLLSCVMIRAVGNRAREMGYQVQRPVQIEESANVRTAVFELRAELKIDL